MGAVTENAWEARHLMHGRGDVLEKKRIND
jgi:hypothetical protein